MAIYLFSLHGRVLKAVRNEFTFRKQIFKDDNDFAWRLLEAEAIVHVKTNIQMIDITTLSELYMVYF